MRETEGRLTEATPALLDTSIIVRFLLNDHPEHSEKSRRLFERIEAGLERARITHVILAECVYVLRSPATRRLPRGTIAEVLQRLLEYPALVAVKRPVLREALRLYAETSLDFDDAYLAATALDEQCAVISFDRDFDRIPGIERREP